MRLAPSAALAGVLALAACSPAAPPAPSAVTPAAPPLIRLTHFFASRESTWGYRVSPDGTRLGWLGSHGGRSTVLVRTLDGNDVRPIDTRTRRSIGSFRWARDSRRLLYALDEGGDENHHIYLASSDRPDAVPVDLTPVAGTRAFIQRVIRSDPDHIVLAWNRRDRSVFDLYRVNLDTRAHTLIAENPGDVIDWMTDREGRPLARVRHVGADARTLELFRGGRWDTVQRFDLEEFDVRMLGATPDARGVWLLSSRGRDRAALVHLDVVTGVESAVHEDQRLDIEWVTMSDRTGAPLAAFTYPGRQAIHFVDRALGADLERLRGDTPTGVYLVSFDDDERLVTLELFTEKGPEHWLVDRRSGERRLLARHPILAFADGLSATEPIELTARDGVRLHGYLTRPPGFSAPGPVVLLVHGGHWARDYWRYDRVVQFLANRGYAVLQVNYRGSTGYGRAFRERAVGQYAGAMHDDLVDAVTWAVRTRVADVGRVAIYGGSYGGYAALVGMTFTPDVFACGVAVVAISNLVTFYETVPPYWKLSVMPLFHRYVGDPTVAGDRQRLEAKSPLFKADQVQRPMLLIHGARDPRVNVRESDQMVAALRKAGKDVRYVVFPDEGHTREYGNWRNAVRHYAEVEDFLAGCLGGRVSPLSERFLFDVVAPPAAR